MLEDTKWVIKNCKLKNDRQYNCQTKKEKKEEQWSTKHRNRKMELHEVH